MGEVITRKSGSSSRTTHWRRWFSKKDRATLDTISGSIENRFSVIERQVGWFNQKSYRFLDLGIMNSFKKKSRKPICWVRGERSRRVNPFGDDARVWGAGSDFREEPGWEGREEHSKTAYLEHELGDADSREGLTQKR